MPIHISYNTKCARWTYVPNEIMEFDTPDFETNHLLRNMYDQIEILKITTKPLIMNHRTGFEYREHYDLYTIEDFTTRVSIIQLPIQFDLIFRNVTYIEMKFINLPILPPMPVGLHRLMMLNTGIKCIDNLLSHTNLHEIQLEDNPLLVSTHLHLPTNLYRFQAGNQQFGTIFSPSMLTHLILFKCHVDRIHGLPVTFENEQHFNTKLRMINCTTPYADNIVNYTPTNSQLINRYMVHHDYDSFDMMASINTTNRDLDQNFTDLLGMITFHVNQAATNNIQKTTNEDGHTTYSLVHHTSTMNYIEQVFVLSSNYPRRIMEFMVDY